MHRNRFKRSLGVKLQDMVIGMKGGPARSQDDIQFAGLFAKAGLRAWSEHHCPGSLSEGRASV